MNTIRHGLMRSMPFRLALAFTLLYVLCFAVGSLFYYSNLQERILIHVNQTVTERHQAAKKVFDTSGIEAVTALIETSSNNPMRSVFGYHLATVKGESIAGNIPSRAIEMGWLDVHSDELGFDNDAEYRFYTAQLGEHLLSIGRSVQQPEAVRMNLISSFFPTFLITTIAALIGGLILASRSHSRVRSIMSSMNSVANGNLNARLPISQRSDDIDNLSSNMNDALTLLQQQIDGMKQVSANIAHDLKTPLNRLLIKIEEAAIEAESGKPVQDKLERVLEEAGNINSTFEALLRISQIEAGARKSQFVGMDLLPTIQTAVEVYEAVVEENGQTLSLKLHESVEENAGLHLLGDKELLLQMIVNIIENAIRHCPEGTDIVIKAGVKNGIVYLSMCDNGPGVPAESREKVFERLYRLESSRTTKGAGLGLSLVKAVADLHCGTVVLEDNEPGLCVKIVFDLDCPVDF